MNTQLQTIKKSITINAPREKVWEVLLQDKLTRLWYAEFSEGTKAETDWKEGSKVLFTDDTGSGMVGKVVAVKPTTLSPSSFRVLWWPVRKSTRAKVLRPLKAASKLTGCLRKAVAPSWI